MTSLDVLSVTQLHKYFVYFSPKLSRDVLVVLFVVNKPLWCSIAKYISQLKHLWVCIKLVLCGTDGRLLLSGFQAVVTLTLTLDRVIRHAVVRQSSTSIYTPNFIEIGNFFVRA